MPGLALLLLLISAPDRLLFASQQSALPLSQALGKTVGQSLAYYLDESRQLDIADISAAGTAFVPVEREAPNYGLQTGNQWFRLVLTNDTSEAAFIIRSAYSIYDEFDFYFGDENNRYQVARAGQYVLVKDLPIPRVNPTFLVSLPPGQTRTFYFRFYVSGTASLPLQIMTVRQEGQLLEIETLVMGIFFGIILIMAIYNFFLFLSIRDRSYLYYVIYLVFIFMSFFSYRGYTDLYLYPDTSIRFRHTMVYLYPAWASISLLLLIKKFLNFFDKSIIDRIIKLLLGAGVLVSLFHIAFPWHASSPVMIAYAILVDTFGLVAAIAALRRGYRPARFFLLGWSIFLIGTIVFMLKIAGFLPHVFFLEYANQIGSAMEAALISFALADKIKILQEEKNRLARDVLLQEQQAREQNFRLDVLRLKTELIESELEMAQNIQLNLLPAESLPACMAALYIPMHKIGGDFYDVLPLPGRGSHKKAIFISDVSGHGIPAALLTMMIKSILHREFFYSPDARLLADPAAMLQLLHERISPHLNGNFVSALYAVMDSQTRHLHYSAAGHPPPLLLKKDSCEFVSLSPQGYPLGIEGSNFNKEYTNLSQQFAAGDRLLFYSDGLMDNAGYAFLEQNRGYENFRHTCLYTPLRQQADSTVQDFMQHLSLALFGNLKGEPMDDICALAVEF